MSPAAPESSTGPTPGGAGGESFCTPCCRDKRTEPQPLPAIERYASPRIGYVAEEARRLGRPLLILSGRFGLLDANEPIPWYDGALTERRVPALVPLLVEQLRRVGSRRLVLFARPRTTPGWEPYHAAIERACAAANIPFELRAIGDDVAESRAGTRR